LSSPGPELFGSEGLASVEHASDQNGKPALNLDLTPAAARLFADYSGGHVGEQLAIVVDGHVAAAPIIQGAIPGGTIQITNEASTGGFALNSQLDAILIGGVLPEAWRDAEVPTVISRNDAVAIAFSQPQV